MRIACPACNAAYQVPDAQLGEGRLVRCVRCGTDWAPVVLLPEPEPEPEPVPQPEPEPAPPVPEPAPPSRQMVLDDDGPAMPLPKVPVPKPAPRPRRGLPMLAIAWVASLAVLAAACASLVVGRERVMAVWPPSARAYAGLGLDKR